MHFAFNTATLFRFIGSIINVGVQQIEPTKKDKKVEHI